jgi:hypothetical protein
MALQVDKIQRDLEGDVAELLIGPGEGAVSRIRIEDDGDDGGSVKIMASDGSVVSVGLRGDFEHSEILKDDELIG